jgi:dihydrofolate synthase
MSIDLSLDRIRRLATYLQPYTRPTCHVAGTNGKGSVTALLASILRASDPPLSVGRFNSPHLVSVHDCIAINGESIDPDVYQAAYAEVQRVDKAHTVGASSFELLTLTAFLIFEQRQVDVAIVEVGMGGRLDATNVMPDEVVLVSALASVDLDHQAFLGSTIAAISGEKAAIARKARPFVLGPQVHSEVFDVARRVIEETGSHLIQASAAVPVDVANSDRDGNGNVGDEPVTDISNSNSDRGIPTSSQFRFHRHQPIQYKLSAFASPLQAQLPLLGHHQLDNAGLALTVVDVILTHSSCAHVAWRDRISSATIQKGIAQTIWPGRLSFHTLTARNAQQPETAPRELLVLADGAHNPASATTLGAYVSDLFSSSSSSLPPSSVVFILALSHSPPKTPRETIGALFAPLVDKGVGDKISVVPLGFSPPEGMPWVKHVPTEEIRNAVVSLLPTTNIIDPPIGTDYLSTLRNVFEDLASIQDNKEDRLIVVAGSLYLVADFYRLLNQQ